MKTYNSPFTFQMRKSCKRTFPSNESLLTIKSYDSLLPKKLRWQFSIGKEIYDFCKKQTIPNNKRTSFTLIEIIITIIFIGVFGALVFSSTSGVFLKLADPEVRIVNSSELQSAVEEILNTYQTGASGGVYFHEDLNLFTNSTFSDTNTKYTYNGTTYNISTRFVKVEDSDGNIIGDELSPGSTSKTPFTFIDDSTSDNNLLELKISHPDQAGMELILFLPQK